jgi:hypothetical protein
MKPDYRFLFFLVAMVVIGMALHAKAQRSFMGVWQDRVNRTQAEQSRWVTPLVTVTPRLELEFRTDFTRQITDTYGYLDSRKRQGPGVDSSTKNISNTIRRCSGRLTRTSGLRLNSIPLFIRVVRMMEKHKTSSVPELCPGFLSIIALA